MPDSPIDDPFADLFGKLPDPRTRATGAVPSNSADGAGSAMTPESQTPAVPSSRRAARAAARQPVRRRRRPLPSPLRSTCLLTPARLAPAAGTAHAAAAARARIAAGHDDHGAVDRVRSRRLAVRRCERRSACAPVQPDRRQPGHHGAGARRDPARRRLRRSLHRRGFFGYPRPGATPSEQAAPPDRRMDRARGRADAVRRRGGRRPLGVEHLRGEDPRVHGLGGAEGLRRGAGQRRGPRHDRLRRQRQHDLDTRCTKPG